MSDSESCCSDTDDSCIGSGVSDDDEGCCFDYPGRSKPLNYIKPSSGNAAGGGGGGGGVRGGVGGGGGNDNDATYRMCMESIRILRKNKASLSRCGFYYGGKLDSASARSVLSGCEEGTFLLRDSQNGGFLYALSAKTSRGPTSIRIAYEDCRFRMDSEPECAHALPRFDSVLALIEYLVYRRELHCYNSARDGGVAERENKKKREVTLIQLRTPLLRVVPSLKHLCVVRVNREMRMGGGLALDGVASRALASGRYPFCV